MKKNIKILSIIVLIVFSIFFNIPKISIAYNSTQSTLQSIDGFKKTIDKEELYIKGQAIIVYNDGTYISSSRKSSSNEYKIVDSVKFSNENFTISKKSQENTRDMNTNTENLKISLVSSDKYSTEQLINILKANSNIMFVEPNYVIKSTNITNDEYENFQWAIENNGQNAGTQGKDINPILPDNTNSNVENVIAIVDSGVDYTNSELTDIMWVNPYDKNTIPGTYGYDFANNDEDPMDDEGHGTHCAGIIGASSNNNNGITGGVLGANNIKIMALKVLDNSGNGSLYNIIKAYNYIYSVQNLRNKCSCNK